MTFTRSLVVGGAFAIIAFLTGETHAADWPTWRYDANRRGASPEELPEKLHLQWTLELPTPRPAWPSNQEKLAFDQFYQPVLQGKTLFVPSMVADKVTAYDTDSGKEKWKFFAEGPVRFAPVIWRDNVYFVSDDGYLYCLNTQGELQWKFRGGPSARQVLGNDRLVSAWPARGAPVVYDGVVYFGASIWPFMGIFLHALNAETGEVVWTNSGTGSNYLVQQHNSPAFAGVAPQGYLAATDKHLLVAGGRTIPATFDRLTGELLHYNLSSRAMGSKGGGGYDAIAFGDHYINRGCLYDLNDGTFLGQVDAQIVGDFSIIGKDANGLHGYFPQVEEVDGKDRRGQPIKKTVVKTSWTAPLLTKIEKVFIKSGSRLYCSGEKGEILVVELPKLARGAHVTWQVSLPDKPRNLITGDGKLFISTDAGRIYCFGAENHGLTPPKPEDETNSDDKQEAVTTVAPRDLWTERATQVLRQAAVDAGYCLALGLGSGRLVEELARQSDLHVIVIEPDATLVERARRYLDDRGVYGTRISLLAGEPLTSHLPQYMADLVVSEEPSRWGFGVEGDSGAEFIQNLFRILRPYSGVAGFFAEVETAERFATRAQGLDLDHGVVERLGELTLLRRYDAPAGSGDWTHQYGDAANTVVSKDTRVKAPLGLLWFGGPSNAAVLPRHGHGPAPQVVGGRLYIEGADMIRAVDIYTGRLLWERELKGVGRYYNKTSHEPGANAIGSNYVSMSDGIYVVHNDVCLRLDPASGETVSEFRLPTPEESKSTAGEKKVAPWGYIAVWENILVAGAQPEDFETPEFKPRETRRIRGDALKKALEQLAQLKDFTVAEKKESQTESDHFLDHLNSVLMADDMVGMIPLRVRFRVEAEAAEKKLTDYLTAVPGRTPRDYQALVLKRELLHLYYQLPTYVKKPAGMFGSELRVGSKKLLVMDRYTGKVLWEHEARHQMRHNAIALGGGFVFYIDRLSKLKADYFRRRGRPVEETPTVTALDIRTGAVRWSTSENVFGTFLSYSEEHDVLLQAGSAASDRASDEVGRGMIAYRAAKGDVLWERDDEYSGPCLLLGDRVITQGYRSPGFALDINTGEKRMQMHPVSGVATEWQYTRNYGCNTGVGSPNMLLFRSAAAGYYDLSGNGGTGNFGGFRAGCTSNLIPAGGILNAPDYTRTCTCSYQNQSSLGLIHSPDIDTWTFSPYHSDYRAVQQVGFNFGAPGDRRGPDGTFWLDAPTVGGRSPGPLTAVFAPEARYRRHHPTRIQPHDLRWVGASAFEGRGELAVKVLGATKFTVPNEVSGQPPLSVEGGLASPIVVNPVYPSGLDRNWTSLQKGRGESLVAKIATFEALASDSVSVEFWTRAAGDFAYVSATSAEEDVEQGFIIDKRVPRVQYYVRNESGDGHEAVVTVEMKEALPADKWTHIAFTYNVANGVGKLFRDGKEVASHDGPDGRSLYWKTVPVLQVGSGATSSAVHLDELRIATTVLEPKQFLVTTEGRGAAESVIGYWRMTPEYEKGTEASEGRLYTVRLVFAELDDIAVGDRVFNVGLQDEIVLSDFDIVREAAGTHRTIVREFRGVRVHDVLRVRLGTAGGRAPLLSGVQLVAEDPTSASGD